MWLRSSVFPREARSRLQKRGNFYISLKLFLTGLVRRDEYTGGEENTRTRGGKSGRESSAYRPSSYWQTQGAYLRDHQSHPGVASGFCWS